MHIQSLLKFLGIQRRHWLVAVEKSQKTVLASVRAFHLLHTVRFGRLPEDARPPHEPDHSDDDSVDEIGGVLVKRSPPGPIAPLAGRQKTLTQTPQHPPEVTQGPPKRGALWSIVQLLYYSTHGDDCSGPSTLGSERQSR
jgi:hypothetical protein